MRTLRLLDILTAKVSITSIRDKITDVLFEQGGSTVSEGREVSFFYQVTESLFVLRNNLRYTTKVSIDDFEVVSYAHNKIK